MIPFIDLSAQYELLKEEISENIQKVLRHGKYIMGPEVQELEQRLGEYTGVKHVITCSNGTDALLMPLMAWDIGPGDAVFTTPFTFMATAEVISLLGATPVFVDIDPDTYNIDPKLLDKAISEVLKDGRLTPKAVIPVDLFGLPADYDSISQIASDYKLMVLEDAAQGFGSEYKGKKACSFGSAAATSFFPAKPFACYGDGGAMFTNNDELAVKLRSICVHGQGLSKYQNVRIGLNSRLDTIQAAILLAKFKLFDKEIAARNNAAANYTEALNRYVKTPVIPEGSRSAWAQYSILANHSKQRAILQGVLKKAGIPTMIYYSTPLHLQKAFDILGYKKGDLPVSEMVSSKIFSLPMHPYLSDETIAFIIDKLKYGIDLF